MISNQADADAWEALVSGLVTKLQEEPNDPCEAYGYTLIDSIPYMPTEDLAMDVISRLANIEPNNGSYQRLYGQVLERSGDLTGAIAAYERAGQVGDRDPEAMKRLEQLKRLTQGSRGGREKWRDLVSDLEDEFWETREEVIGWLRVSRLAYPEFAALARDVLGRLEAKAMDSALLTRQVVEAGDEVATLDRLIYSFERARKLFGLDPAWELVLSRLEGLRLRRSDQANQHGDSIYG